MTETIQSMTAKFAASDASRRRYFLIYFIGVWLILLGGFMAAAYWSDERTVAYHEKLFNDQQALQVLLARRGFEDRLSWTVTHVTSVARIAVPRDSLRPEGALMTVSQRLFEHPGVLAAGLYSTAGDTPYWFAGKSARADELRTMLDNLVTDLANVPETTGLWVSNFFLRPDRQYAGLAVPVPRTSFDAPVKWLLAVIDLGALLQHFIAPLRSGQYGAGYALDRAGRIVYDHETEIIGRSVFDGMHDKYPNLLKLDRRMVSETEGTGEYRFTVKRGGPESRKLIAWNTLTFGNKYIVIALSAPDLEVNALLGEHRRNLMVAGGLLLIGFIGTMAIFFRMRHQLLEQTTGDLRQIVKARTEDLNHELAARVRYEHDLKESEQRFRDFAESASDWFWEMDAELRFTYHSPRYFALTGFTPEQKIGTRRTHFVDAAARRRDKEKWGRHDADLANRRPFRGFEYRFKSAKGVYMDVRISGVPIIDADGKFHGYRGTGTDITEHKMAEEARQEALAEAEHANRVKSEFLATMSHELRTPLNAILGFSDILTNQYFGPPGAGKYREYAADIHASAEHLLELVNDLLDISVIEAGKTPLSFREIDLKEIISDCLRTVGEKAYAVGVDLHLDIAEVLPPISADKRAVRQILLNLLSNAVKFTPDGGRISVSAMGRGGETEIRVADTGSGIPPEYLEDVTKPFTRVETNPYRSEQGSGLGLAITKSLVDLHGGTMTIESALGEGTTVVVALPNALAGRRP